MKPPDGNRPTRRGLFAHLLIAAGSLGILGGCGSPASSAVQGPRPLGTRIFFAGPTRAVEFNHNSQPVLVFWFDCDGDPNAMKSFLNGSVIPGARGMAPGDRNGGWRVGGSAKTGGLTTLNSEVRTQNGRRVAFEWVTTNARTGQVRIDGQEYNMADGDLFLVSTRSEPSQIRQLKRNFRNVRLTDADFLKDLTKHDPDVAKFIAQATPPVPIPIQAP